MIKYFPENLSKIGGRKNHPEIFTRVSLILRALVIFHGLQSNPKHTSHATTLYYFETPPNSPDLMPIEMVRISI